MHTNKAGWPKEPIEERECSGCNGTGFLTVGAAERTGAADIPATVLEVRGQRENCRQVSDDAYSALGFF
jgi:hypothetical protein